MSKVTRIINSRTGEEFILGGEGGGNSTIPETFSTNMEVGGIAANTTITAGTSIAEIIKNMLLKIKYAFVKSNPLCSITSTTSASVERGTTVSDSHTATYTDGKFTEYYNNGNSSRDKNARCAQGATTFTKKVGIGREASYTNGTSFVVNEATIIKATIAYGESEYQPTNSDGSTTVSIAAGTCSSGKTYTPYLGYFFKTSDTVLDATRANFGTPTLLTGNSATTTKAFDKKYVYVAVPSAYKIASAISANNEPQDYKTMTNTTIADAGGTMQDYKVYMYEYAAALDVNVTISITKA